jgi:fructose-bisphosphate aldolase, class II
VIRRDADPLSHQQLLTDPAQCVDFVSRTGVDALAIARRS